MAHLQLVKQTSSGLLLPATPESGDFLRSVKIGEWIHADFKRVRNYALLNSLYMFANASIQGTANMMRSLAHLNGDGPLLQRLRWSNLNMAQKMALTAVGAGYLLGSLNRAGAGQDEDGVNWYDKVPDYVKEHNLVIMKSLFGGKAGEYWSIPLPYGYNMFYLLGSTAEGVTRGNLTASKAAGNIVGGMLGAFNPLGSEDSKTLTGTLFKNAAPTILRPVADLWANESFMGTPIYQENFPTGTPKPESTLGRRSTPEAYKAFANWLNTLTGGSQYRSGALDINPDKMKYWIDYVSGGMGRFAGKTIDAAAKTYNGIDIPPQQIPFLGKISGKVMPYADQQAMYDHIDELRQYNAELKSLSGAGRAVLSQEMDGNKSHSYTARAQDIDLGTKTTSSFDYGTKSTNTTGNHTNQFGGYINSHWGDSNHTSFQLGGGAWTQAAGDHAHTVYIGGHEHTMYIGPHGHVVIVDADGNAETFGLMDGGVDAAITAYFGSQLQERVQQNIIREYLGEQPVGTAFVIETGNSKHPWLVHAPTMRVPLIIDGTDAVYNATRAALLAIFQHNKSAGEDRKITSVALPAMGAGCGQVPPDSVARQIVLI
ncbi:DUF1367 family protein [Salmonella enterica]|nr:DUF1367 family protein [Salmonella enterica]EGA7763820.1 DUF1367 family protein [Salmonella enterica]EGO0841546.1 DUF1367 family protein [Salmonella enterica]